MKTFIGSILGALVLFVAASTSHAAMIDGSNAKLTQYGNSIYNPMLAADSGTLGASLGGSREVGKQSERFTLKGVGAQTQGDVTFKLTWALATGMENDSASIVLTLTRCYFGSTNVGASTVTESMDLTFLPDPSDAAGAINLTINASNYGNYRQGGFGNCEGTVVYTLGMMDDLGISTAQMDAISTEGDLDFAMQVTIHTQVTYASNSATTYVTHPLTFVGQLGMTPAQATPEPATLVLLSAGLVVFVRGRRKIRG